MSISLPVSCVKQSQVVCKASSSKQKDEQAGRILQRDEAANFGYSPIDKTPIWDSWVCYRPVQKDYLLYSLNNSSVDKNSFMHEQVRVRAAQTKNFKDIKDLGIVLKPSERFEDKDNLSIWTGSTIYDKDNGKYYFYYTGRDSKDYQRVGAKEISEKPFTGMIPQRVFIASSDDGINWKADHKPVIDLDLPENEWYENESWIAGDSCIKGSEANFFGMPVGYACRDPFVVKDDGKYIAFFAANDNKKRSKELNFDPHYRACVGVAVADSPEGPFKLKPPVLTNGKYNQMEVPMHIKKGDKHYLFFSNGWDCLDKKPAYNPEWAAKIGVEPKSYRLNCYVSDNGILGDYKPLKGTGIVKIPPNIYDVQFVEDKDNPGQYNAIGWFVKNREREDGRVEQAFSLAPLMKVNWDDDNINVEFDESDLNKNDSSF